MVNFGRRLKLTTKFVYPVVGVTLLSLLIGAGFVVREVKSLSSDQVDLAQNALKAEQQSAEQAQLAALQSKADIIGRFMAKTAPDLIVSYDFSSLKTYQEEATSDPQVAYAAYLNADGTPMTEYDENKDADIVEKRYPIQSEGENLGFVLLAMNKATLNDAIAASDGRISAAIASVKNAGADSMARFVTIIFATIVGVLLCIVAVLFALFRLQVVRPLKETYGLINTLSAGEGNLTVRLPVNSGDELGTLRASLNGFVEQLHAMISAIVEEVQSLSNEANELRAFGSELAGSSERQRSETTQVVTAMSEMAATVQEVARNAHGAATATDNAAGEASTGREVVAQTIQSIDALAADVENATAAISKVQQDSDRIGAVLDVIKGISEQTNLLALNAAIEAARAGEQGRGFAVVAEEVRTLASRTHESTEEIQDMIERLQAGAEEAVRVMEQNRDRATETVAHAGNAGTSLDTIASAVTSVNDMNTQIATAAEQQSAVAAEIDRNVVAINAISETTAAGAERTAHASQKLSELTVRLQDLVGKFEI